MRIGRRFNVTCAPLMLDGMYLKYVETVKYLVVVNAGKSFKCSMEHIRMRFIVFLLPCMQKHLVLILNWSAQFTYLLGLVLTQSLSYT